MHYLEAFSSFRFISLFQAPQQRAEGGWAAVNSFENIEQDFTTQADSLEGRAKDITLSDQLPSKGGYFIPKAVQNCSQLLDYMKDRIKNTVKEPTLIFEEQDIAVHSHILDAFYLDVVEPSSNPDAITFENVLKQKNSILCSDGKTVHLNGMEIEILKAKSPFFKAYFETEIPHDNLILSSDQLTLMVLPYYQCEKMLNGFNDEQLIELLKFADLYLITDFAQTVASKINLYERSRAIGEASPRSLEELKQFNKVVDYHKSATEHHLTTLKDKCEDYFSRVLERAYRSSNNALFVDIMMHIKDLDIEFISILPSSQSKALKIDVRKLTAETADRLCREGGTYKGEELLK